MKRRDFLKSLVATAVATQLPNIPVAEAKAVEDALMGFVPRITFNGIEPDGLPGDVTITAAENGWYKFETIRMLGPYEWIQFATYFRPPTDEPYEQGCGVTGMYLNGSEGVRGSLHMKSDNSWGIPGPDWSPDGPVFDIRF